jgi:hypothetical protein
MKRATRLAAALAVSAVSVIGYAGAAHATAARPQAVMMNEGYSDYWNQCEQKGNYWITQGGGQYFYCSPDTKSDGYWLFVAFD